MIRRPADPQPVRIDLAWRDPVAAFAPLEAEIRALLLHDGQSGRARIFAFPDHVLSGTGASDFAVFANAFRQGAGSGLWAGLFNYDLASAFERLPGWDETSPDLLWARYPVWAEFDKDADRLSIHGPDTASASQFAARLGEDALAPVSPAAAADWRAHWEKATYLAAAEKARDYVHAGDIFQVNLSQRFNAELAAEDTPWAVFQRLCSGSPAPHAAYFRVSPDEVVITNSPERFLALHGCAVEARPIKGTRKRDKDRARDEALKAELLASVKDRAENLMIVDLMRNDLSRVCRAGSVKVPSLCEVESYANVHHLVSVVTGELLDGRDAIDLLAASFPPGSITGAPKVRAMQIISELEGEARGAYCGALGWMGAEGLDLNVMIRTVTLQRTDGRWQAQLRSGGAIIADSDPLAEYEETLTKASALRAALGAGSDAVPGAGAVG